MPNPPIIGFHIEPTNICTLKCSGCARTRFIENWPNHWKNHSIDTNELMQFLDIDLAGIDIFLCGNYGDPIYHPDFIGFVSAFKKRGANIIIGTNGSYKTKTWWKELCDVLSPQDTVVFSVDGMPDNFTQYRVNGDWPSIEVGIHTCVENGINTTWKYIPFSFNVDDIERARELSQQLGMKKFWLDPSDRFDDQTQHLMPMPTLVGERLVAQSLQHNTVDPECAQGDTFFITAQGHFTPCCFVADHRFYFKTEFGKLKSEYDIRTRSFSQIYNQPSVVNFYQNIPSSPPAVCKFNCPGKK
jgi:MoaA/NifB/PqqE/SkfB family radical SAM enzyme